MVQEETRFIGRSDELAAVSSLLSVGVAADRPLALISGAAGLGKTRLMDELARRTDRSVTRLLVGRGREEVRFPYGPIAEALRDHAELLLERCSAPTAAILRGLFGSRPTRSDSRESARQRLFVAVSDALHAMSRDRPTLLMLDDLHWFDPDSLDLFEHLAFSVTHPGREAPLSLVATLREPEAESRLARLVARLSREVRCIRVQLEGLDAGETGELVRGLGGAPAAQKLVTRLRRETGGNPLFVKEIVRDLIRAHQLEQRRGYLTATEAGREWQLPADVTAAVQRRVSRLPRACRDALATAALIGQEFTLASLALLLDCDEESAIAWLEEASKALLIEDHAHAYRFAHPLVRFVCERQVAPARRARMHVELARRLAREPDPRGEHVFAIAHHWLQAAAAGDSRARLDATRRAAERALELLAWAESARFFEAAAAAAKECAEDAGERARLHYLAGYYFHRNWDAGPALQHYDRAVELYRDRADVRGSVNALKERLRASVTIAGPELDASAAARELEGELSELGEADPSLRARALDALATYYWSMRGGGPRAGELAQEAMAIARRQADPGLASEIASIAALIHLGELDVGGALAVWQSGAADAQRAGDAHRAAQALFRVPMAELQLGRLERARAAAQVAHQRDRELGNPEVALTQAAECSEACLRGELAVVESTAAAALQRVRQSGYLWPRAVVLSALACARSLRGEFPLARDAIALLVEKEWGQGEVTRQQRASQILGALAARLERGSAVRRAALPERPVLLPRSARYDVALLPLFCAQVDCAFLAARPELARGMREPLALARECGSVFTLGWSFSVLRCLGLADALAGNRQTGSESLREARTQALQAGAGAEAARSALDLARLLAAEDPGSARTLAREAFEEIRGLGLRGLGRAAAELAAELKLRVPELDQEVAPMPLGERSVLAAVALGRSDEEIAQELTMRSDTVASQRSSVLERIGAHSSAEATAWAVERDLGGAAQQVRAALDAFVGGAADRGELVIAVTDLRGSTRMMEKVGDRAARDLLRTHNRRVRACVREHGGLEIQHTGDGFILAFRSAATALACLCALRRELARYNAGARANARLQVRIGAHAGHVLPDEGRLVGLAMNTAARICSAAAVGEVLVSASVRRLTGTRNARFGARKRVSLKGRRSRLALYPVLESPIRASSE